MAASTLRLDQVDERAFGPREPRGRGAWRTLLAPRRYPLLAAGVLLLAVALRWTLACTVYLLPDSDQVMVGLMARHMLRGEWPIFYWGQPYNGTLESAITALVFRLCGAGYAAIHVAPAAFSVLFVAATMSLSRQLYGRREALLCGVFLALGPALLLRFSVWPGYNYLQAMAFGTLALTLALSISRGGGWWRLPPAMFLLGLAFWAQPLAMVYAPALALLLAGPALATWRAGGARLHLLAVSAAALGALALGAIPIIYYNLHVRITTLGFLAGRPNNLHLSLGEEARRLAFWAAPVFTALVPPSADPAQFQRFLMDHPLRYDLSLTLLALGLLLLATRWRTVLHWGQSLAGARPAGEAALGVLALTLLGGYLFSTWSSSSWSDTEPRYLLPLFTLTPMLIRALFPPDAGTTRHVIGACVAMMMVIGGLAANATAPCVGDVRPLAGYLERQGITAIYGDYWLVYRLAFVSDERLTPVVIRPVLAFGLNRYPPYLRVGLRATRIAWGIRAHSGTERAILRCLARHHAPFQRHVFVIAQDRWTILDHIPAGVRCLPRWPVRR
jgi:hypothetical protein